MRSLGYPLVTYVNQVPSAVTVGTPGGLLEIIRHGIVVAAVGCLRGFGDEDRRQWSANRPPARSSAASCSLRLWMASLQWCSMP